MKEEFMSIQDVIDKVFQAYFKETPEFDKIYQLEDEHINYVKDIKSQTAITFTFLKENKPK